MRHLIDIPDLSVREIDELVRTADDIIANPEAYAHKCAGKKLATLFYEPSTRTRLSFEAAMYELGGNVIGFSDSKNTSASKGESMSDTLRIVSCYADIIAMRHYIEGSAYAAAMLNTVPIINAGDGGHCHPTQTLTDLMTIHREKGRFTDLTVGFCGDLKYGRTVHSLINALARYSGIKYVLISPEELKIPDYLREMMDENRLEYTETYSLEDALPSLDILYMTRIQRERFTDPEAYERLKDSYILTADLMKTAPAEMSVMHPLPRVNEISTDVDSDPRACYFRQALYGKYIRMALIVKLLENRDTPATSAYTPSCGGYVCPNNKCITAYEPNLPKLYDPATLRCTYCESICVRKN